MEQILAKTLLAGFEAAPAIPEGQMIRFVTTDSRQVGPDCVFVPSRGRNSTAMISPQPPWKRGPPMWCSTTRWRGSRRRKPSSARTATRP